MKRTFAIITFLAIFALAFMPVVQVNDSQTVILLHGNGLPVVDETGRTWTNVGVTFAPSGHFGGALSFNGNQEINTPDFADSYLGDGRPFTFDWWMYLDSLPTSGNKYSVYSQGTDPSHFINVEIYMDGTTPVLVLETANGGISVAIRNMPTLTTNSWNHFAITGDGTNYGFTFYLNCNRLTSGYSNPLNFVNYSTPVRIGRHVNQGHGVRGDIDEFRLSRTVRFSGPTCTLPASEYAPGVTATPSHTATVTNTPASTFTPTITETMTVTPTATDIPTQTPFPTATPIVFKCPDGMHWVGIDAQSVECVSNQP